jgi:hypothetical protein
MTEILVATIAIATGVTSKFADLLNEHGVSWFRLSGPVLGLIWGPLALALTLLDPWVGALWVGTVLYWFLTDKLDHFNHAFAGVCVMLAGLYMAHAGRLPLLATGGLLLWLTASGYLNTYLKTTYPQNTGLQSFLRLRLRYYLGPVVLTVVGHTWLPIVAIAAGMAGTELVTIWHARMDARGLPAQLPFGMAFTPEHVELAGASR